MAASSAAAGTIALRTSDFDVVELYATDSTLPGAPTSDAPPAVPTLGGLKFAAIDVIAPGLEADDVAHQAREQIKEWTGAQNGPFDPNVTLAALVSGSIDVPGEAGPPTDIAPLAVAPGSSVAPTRGALAPGALAAVMPPTVAGVVSPSLSSPLSPPAIAPAAPAAVSAPAPVSAPPPPASPPVATPAPSSGPSALTVVAIGALIITAATTIAVQSGQSRPRRHRPRTPRDF
ncbi:MAG TPA: hypothetical protein VFO19_10575 [Vicinamibacterales bacterium]|nr:hypothetical protein [Vicinamibacterales bacterium]